MSSFDDPGGSSSNAQHVQVSVPNDQEIAIVQDVNDLDSRADETKDVTPVTFPQQSTNGLKEKKKRRRLDDLGFSSPGPAFLTSASISSDGGGTESESDTNRIRPRRQSRLSSQVINGNTINGSNQSKSRSITPTPPNNPHQQNNSTVSHSKPKKPSIFRNFTPKSSEQQTLHPTSKVNGKGKDVDRSVGELSQTVNGNRDSIAGSSRKDLLLNERRKQMDKVYKDHDMLVRELFHLHKFVTLFGFDPEVSISN